LAIEDLHPQTLSKILYYLTYNFYKGKIANPMCSTCNVLQEQNNKPFHNYNYPSLFTLKKLLNCGENTQN